LIGRIIHVLGFSRWHFLRAAQEKEKGKKIQGGVPRQGFSRVIGIKKELKTLIRA
jgi:hypothetical protein